MAKKTNSPTKDFEEIIKEGKDPKEPVEGEETEKEEEPKEEPKEKPKEETEKEPKEPAKEPVVPLKEIAEEIKKKTQEDYKKKVLDAIGITSEEEEKAKEEGYVSPWEKRGEDKPATWKEAVEAGAELAEFKRKEAEKVAKVKEEKTLAQIEEQNKNINADWNKQLDALREKERIPKIAPKVLKKMEAKGTLTDEDRKDPGLVVQRELFEIMYQVSVEREKQSQSPIRDLFHIYHEYYVPKKKQPGATAPVSAGKPGAPIGSEDKMDYPTLHKTGFDTIIEEGSK